MKINKEFAPITITIETVEDRNQFLNILEAADRKEIEQGFMWKGCIPTTSIISQSNLSKHIAFIRNKLM